MGQVPKSRHTRVRSEEGSTKTGLARDISCHLEYIYYSCNLSFLQYFSCNISSYSIFLLLATYSSCNIFFLQLIIIQYFFLQLILLAAYSSCNFFLFNISSSCNIFFLQRIIQHFFFLQLILLEIFLILATHSSCNLLFNISSNNLFFWKFFYLQEEMFSSRYSLLCAGDSLKASRLGNCCFLDTCGYS